MDTVGKFIYHSDLPRDIDDIFRLDCVNALGPRMACQQRKYRWATTDL
jgi:hypothetical protein